MILHSFWNLRIRFKEIKTNTLGQLSFSTKRHHQLALMVDACLEDAWIHGEMCGVWHVMISWYGPLVRYVKLRVAHAPGMSVTFSQPPRVSDPDMHHGTCVTHVPWCVPGSRYAFKSIAGKLPQHSRRMRSPQLYISCKRPMETLSTSYCPLRVIYQASVDTSREMSVMPDFDISFC